MVGQVREMLEARVAALPRDELAELTGITAGPTTPPADRVLARLLPDFHREDATLSGGLRALHEPELLAVKDGVAAVVLETCPARGGRIRLTDEQAQAWLSALNDVRLALGTVLEVTEDMPDELPADDPRAPHLVVYHWLTWVQESLIQALAGT
ncbi:MAG: hypothetical protein QOH09_4484 [Pseudonocardiales bacterium]|jgi:hypothetical protein|nr:hypothetical protein [Pseudonocardiales bacterium]